MKDNAEHVFIRLKMYYISYSNDLCTRKKHVLRSMIGKDRLYLLVCIHLEKLLHQKTKQKYEIYLSLL